jgi:hypothetical protein
LFIQERGYQAVYACLASMILGLGIRYVRIRKEILVERSGGSLDVFGRGEIFEDLFEEEFERLTDALANTAAASDEQKGAV